MFPKQPLQIKGRDEEADGGPRGPGQARGEHHQPDEGRGAPGGDVRPEAGLPGPEEEAEEPGEGGHLRLQAGVDRGHRGGECGVSDRQLCEYDLDQ